MGSLLERSWLDIYRKPSLFRAKIFQKSVMALFAGLLYLQTPLTLVGVSNIQGALFYLVSTAVCAQRRDETSVAFCS